MNDADCYMANFWRATATAPADVGTYADWPVNEVDQHARHRWLVNRVDFREKMISDPEFFDAKIAGWWVWGLCQWIGSGWCAAPRQRGDGGPPIQLPHLGDAWRGVHRKLPHLGDAWRGGTSNADGDDVYAEGDRSTFDRAAAWAAEHGAEDRLRICLCGYDGTWAPPSGWITVAWKAAGGYGGQRKDGENVNAHRERLWFSPGCLRPERAQQSLFGLT